MSSYLGKITNIHPLCPWLHLKLTTSPFHNLLLPIFCFSTSLSDNYFSIFQSLSLGECILLHSWFQIFRHTLMLHHLQLSLRHLNWLRYISTHLPWLSVLLSAHSQTSVIIHLFCLFVLPSIYSGLSAIPLKFLLRVFLRLNFCCHHFNLGSHVFMLWPLYQPSNWTPKCLQNSCLDLHQLLTFEKSWFYHITLPTSLQSPHAYGVKSKFPSMPFWAL